MSHAYKAVGWNRQKKVYDLTLLAGVVAYLGLFIGVSAALAPEATIETLLIRAFGTAALLLLHVILSIGPLARLDRRFLPLLYNRRHLGVTMFVLALAHGGFAIVQFHVLGVVNPLVSVLTSNGSWGNLAQFPFQPLGLAALAILFLMAATSHDFWLANLTPPVWKSLHMLVYVAYGLLLLHVALGVLQAESNPLLAGLLGLGFVWVTAIHLVAAARERAADRELARPAEEGHSPAALSNGAAADDGFVEACRVGDIADKRARVVCLGGERVAVFRYDGKISAVSNVCQHQNGPLGEGRILDGCITCPWHGFQYDPADGASPPPFTEKVPTFRVRLDGDRVLVHPRPERPGTRIEPARMASGDDFYVGYQRVAPAGLGRFLRRAVFALLLAAALVAATLAALQGPFDPGVFEFGTVRELTGVVRERPHPLLLVERPGEAASEPSRYFLVNAGKHGADGEVRGLDGRRVRLRGTLIHRQGQTMVEVVAGSVVALGGPGESPSASPNASLDGPPGLGGGEPVDLGVQTLRGEIVDSKCYLGVMKPGRGKPHRACATLCIRGGIPPVLRVVTGTGEARHLLLTDQDGGAINDRILDLVAEPVEVTGRVLRTGDLLMLRAELAAFRRLG